MFTLHVGALAFGVYSCLLPRDEHGHASLPKPLVQLSTDLYACAGGVFLAMGGLMLTLNTFDAGNHDGEGLGATDLYVLGGLLLFVEVVAIWRLVARFSKADAPAPGEEQTDAAVADTATADADASAKTEEEELPSVGKIVFFGVLGLITSVIGGHAVGDFADILVSSLTAKGYSEMVGALILSVFACAGAYVMTGAAHAKGKFDIALANVSGQITQVPFVVMPISLIMIAVFSQLGIVPVLSHGGVLPIDLETTSVTLLAFPPMLILWKAIQDDGHVNWVETASMCAIFGLTLYFLAMHG
jgi:hypothetical protein